MVADARSPGRAGSPAFGGSARVRQPGVASLTGLDYLTDRSDLDLLLDVRRETDLDRFAADVAAIEADAPMRLDGELMRDDGAAVNWREFHAGAREVLVKSIDGVVLLDRSLFISGRSIS